MHLNARVTRISPSGVTLDNDQSIVAKAVVIAADFASASALLPALEAQTPKATTCVYFAADEPPVEEPVLVLNGEPGGPVNNLSVPSVVCPTYAPKGSHLISASIVEPGIPVASAEHAVRDHMRRWFGSQVMNWRHLRTYHIPNALPQQTHLNAANGNSRVSAGLYACGDHRDTASINGALRSGRHAAHAVLADMR